MKIRAGPTRLIWQPLFRRLHPAGLPRTDRLPQSCSRHGSCFSVLLLRPPNFREWCRLATNCATCRLRGTLEQNDGRSTEERHT